MQLIIRLYIIIFDSLLWPGDLFNYFFCYSNNNQERISNNRENI